MWTSPLIISYKQHHPVGIAVEYDTSDAKPENGLYVYVQLLKPQRVRVSREGLGGESKVMLDLHGSTLLSSLRYCDLRAEALSQASGNSPSAPKPAASLSVSS